MSITLFTRRIALATLLLCTPLISFEVEFHQVYHPSDEEKENPELFAKNVRDLMSRLECNML